jgi:CubicO group peptidase (beta-lactamase class C family)
MALAALYVLKQPLPEVLKASIMDPIGASSSWHWEGYDNSWVTIDGRKMKSVSGGGHFGGGMFINAWDMARFGYLFLNRGKWNGRQLISEKWIGMARTPGTATNSAAEAYGFANWFLNTGRKMYPAAPETAVAFRGNGENIVYVDLENDLVVVVRWIQSRTAAEFFAKVLAANMH